MRLQPVKRKLRRVCNRLAPARLAAIFVGYAPECPQGPGIAHLGERAYHTPTHIAVRMAERTDQRSACAAIADLGQRLGRAIRGQPWPIRGQGRAERPHRAWPDRDQLGYSLRVLRVIRVAQGIDQFPDTVVTTWASVELCAG